MTIPPKSQIPTLMPPSCSNAIKNIYQVGLTSPRLSPKIEVLSNYMENGFRSKFFKLMKIFRHTKPLERLARFIPTGTWRMKKLSKPLLLPGQPTKISAATSQSDGAVTKFLQKFKCIESFVISVEHNIVLCRASGHEAYYLCRKPHSLFISIVSNHTFENLQLVSISIHYKKPTSSSRRVSTIVFPEVWCRIRLSFLAGSDPSDIPPPPELNAAGASTSSVGLPELNAAGLTFNSSVRPLVSVTANGPSTLKAG